MDDRSSARYDKFVRVLNFGRANQSDVAKTDAPQHLDKLEQIIKDLNKAKAGQKGGGTDAKDVLVDALRIDVQNITRTASTIGQDELGFESLFQPADGINAASVLTAADAIIGNLIDLPDDDDATKTAKAGRRAKFVAKGLPEHFAQHLVDDREAVNAARTQEDNTRSEGVMNTKLIGTLVTAGMKECNYLDAIFHNVYTRNPEKLRAWMSESHLERAPQRKKKEEADQPEPPQSETPPAAPA